MDKERSFEVTHDRTVPNLQLGGNAACEQEGRAWSHLKEVKRNTGPKHVRVLLGMDVDGAHDVFEIRGPAERRPGPRAELTLFGWCLVGRINDKEDACPDTNHIRLDQLNDFVHGFWATETFGVRPSPAVSSPDEKRAHQLLERTTRLLQQRYVVGLLWKCDDTHLPNN